MKESLLQYLYCPLTQSKLSLTIIKSVENSYQVGIEEGYLTSVEGYVFPIVKGVPRLLLESFVDYKDFLSRHLDNYDLIYQQLVEKYGDLIQKAMKRNKPTKKSFSFEWSWLSKKKKTNIWYLNDVSFKEQLFKEFDLPNEYFTGKIAVDIGCGHGRSSQALAKKCKVCIGVDLGNSIEQAYSENDLENCFFIQADLHHLPFAENSFDIVYSSGVLHHTPDTKNAFDCISKFVNKNGVLCIWLYHSLNSWIHKCMLLLRKITVHLPLRLQAWLYLIFFVPVHKMTSWIKGKPKTAREILITYLDMLSPKYRHEHTTAEVTAWFEENNYAETEMTTTDQYGFSMKGIKKT